MYNVEKEDLLKIFSILRFRPSAIYALSSIKIVPHQVAALFGRNYEKNINGILRQGQGFRVLVADETGLGKTIIACLSYYSLLLRNMCNKTIIIAPRGLLHQWSMELISKLKIKDYFVVITGVENLRKNIDRNRVIVSMDTLKKSLDELNDITFDLTIIDEAHHIFTVNETQRRRIAKWIIERSKNVLLLTATPFRGYEGEKNIYDTLLGKYTIIRRLKDEVIDINGRPIFPKRHVYIYPVDIKKDEYYKKAYSILNKLNIDPAIKLILEKRLCSSIYAFQESIKRIKKLQIQEDSIECLESYLYLNEPDVVKRSDFTEMLVRNPIVTVKERELLNLVKKYISNGEKVVIFTEYLDTLRNLYTVMLKEFGEKMIRVLHGGIPPEERFKIIEEFRNNNKIKVLISTDVGGEGINLQCARIQINYDIPWSPIKLEQRMGRIHRYGQCRDVIIWNMIIKGRRTLDSYVIEKLLDKLKNISRELGDWIYDYVGELVPPKIMHLMISEQMNETELLEYMKKRALSIRRSRYTLSIDRDFIDKIIYESKYLDEVVKSLGGAKLSLLYESNNIINEIVTKRKLNFSIKTPLGEVEVYIGIAIDRYGNVIVMDAVGLWNEKVIDIFGIIDLIFGMPPRSSNIIQERKEGISRYLKRKVKELLKFYGFNPANIRILVPGLPRRAIYTPLETKVIEIPEKSLNNRDIKDIERLAMIIAMEYEKSEGRIPVDVSDRCHYDIESKNPITGEVRFIEVKGQHRRRNFITLETGEYFVASKYPNKYWLYVIYDIKQENNKIKAHILTIQNPLSKLRLKLCPLVKEMPIAILSLPETLKGANIEIKIQEPNKSNSS